MCNAPLRLVQSSEQSYAQQRYAIVGIQVPMRHYVQINDMFNTICNISNYVQHKTLCTREGIMYSTKHYVQQKALCTAQNIMYNRRHYVQ